MLFYFILVYFILYFISYLTNDCDIVKTVIFVYDLHLIGSLGFTLMSLIQHRQLIIMKTLCTIGNNMQENFSWLLLFCCFTR